MKNKEEEEVEEKMNYNDEEIDEKITIYMYEVIYSGPAWCSGSPPVEGFTAEAPNEDIMWEIIGGLSPSIDDADLKYYNLKEIGIAYIFNCNIYEWIKKNLPLYYRYITS